LSSANLCGSGPVNHFDEDPDPAYHFDTDPDPTFQFEADPDPAYHIDKDPDPAYHFYTDPDPTFQFDPDPAYHFDTDLDPADPDPACPDPACHLDTDPDPTFQFDADPDPNPQHWRTYCPGSDGELPAAGAAELGRLRLDPTRGPGVPCPASLQATPHSFTRHSAHAHVTKAKTNRVGREVIFFSSRRNWDSPTPSPAGECASPLPTWFRGSSSYEGKYTGFSTYRICTL
jgi:hypothetical protein